MRTSYDSSAILRSLIGSRITLPAAVLRLVRREPADVLVQELALLVVVEGAADQSLRRLDGQVGHLAAQLLDGLLLLELHLLFSLLDQILGLLARLGQDLPLHPLRLTFPLLDDGGGLAPRLGQDLLVLAQSLLRLGAGLLRLLERLADGFLPLRERRQERLPGELRQKERQK